MRKAFRVVAVGGAICAIALIAPVSSAQPRPSATTGDTNYAEFDSLVSLGMNGPLKLTRDQAVASASSTASRAEFRRLALEKLGTSLVGGYYDSATNVSHVWVTTDDAASVVSDLAAESSTPVEVTAGYADRKVLDDLATRINAEIAKIAPDQSSGVVFGAGVDNATGRVLVTYADESLRAMVERAVDSKDLVDWQLSTEEFHTNSCVSRSAPGCSMKRLAGGA